jgi:integrase
MKLIDLMNSYITFKQSIGMKFRTERYLLLSFCDAMGDVDISEVTSEQVLKFFESSAPPKFWYRRFYALNVFYRFAISRGHVSKSPLPISVPRRRDSFVPYIYSSDELKALLVAVPSICAHPNCILDATCLECLIRLLWGTGLRISEALNLRISDVDLDSDLIIVKDTKFFKTRLVPIDPKLTAALSRHIERDVRMYASGEVSTFFSTKKGKPLSVDLVEHYFRTLCRSAGVVRKDATTRCQPRLHDMRHTFAVSRIVAWYQSGANVQRLLPHLSTYLGHRHLKHTQRYLTVTSEVLRQACNRFEQYALEVDHVKQ